MIAIGVSAAGLAAAGAAAADSESASGSRPASSQSAKATHSQGNSALSTSPTNSNADNPTAGTVAETQHRTGVASTAGKHTTTTLRAPIEGATETQSKAETATAHAANPTNLRTTDNFSQSAMPAAQSVVRAGAAAAADSESASGSRPASSQSAKATHSQGNSALSTSPTNPNADNPTAGTVAETQHRTGVASTAGKHTTTTLRAPIEGATETQSKAETATAHAANPTNLRTTDNFSQSAMPAAQSVVR
ncbi:hypothetical protein, partial [Mycolicibacterium sp. CBMA 335]|uniref:hypothetical protein n=1 Tax=Mycolicibacterium sp. CBMA 335 TaxID=2606603 RepID=UPI00272D5050